MYDYIIVTHLPAFYKVNLYNELAKKLNIFVVFISNETSETRSSDFVSLKNADFEYKVLSKNSFQSRNKLKTLYKLFSAIRNIHYKKILLSGWDLPEFWMVAILFPSSKNCLALESTIIESNIQGVKGAIKKLFLSMISTVFASGDLHVALLKALNYSKEVRVTKGVGIINKPTLIKTNKRYEKRFLFVGRLSKVKNLVLLINIFNELPEHKLTIIGDGEEKENLKSIANENIKFMASIDNYKLQHEFNVNDVFILPSISEPWGLVVEEALYFGLPVIVSERCGASELVSHGGNGYIIDSSLINLEHIINNITVESYNEMHINVMKFSIVKKDDHQVGIYERNNI